ncbi:MAG: hypothetical protein AB8B64_22710 [Granulosicoccus sp.]
MVIPAFGQTPVNAGPDIRDRLPEIVDVRLFKQARYAGSAILIHLPTNKARALIMPEPVTLKGEQAQMPGLELAYAGDVIGFFATRNFTRRPVSFIGADSGIEYRLQIRASQDGITEPLKIVR